MEHKLIDNFLSKEHFAILQSVMVDGDNFPWYLNKYVGDANDDKKHFQFTHTFYRDHGFQSQYGNMLQPVLEKIKPKAILRIKANLGTRASKIEAQSWHVDFPFDCKTAILYLNDNNGYTIFEDGTKIESKANRFVEFDSKYKHSGTSHTDSNVRVLINLNYFK